MIKHSKVFGSYSVNDLQKAKEFYSETLGIRVKDNPIGLIELLRMGIILFSFIPNRITYPLRSLF